MTRLGTVSFPESSSLRDQLWSPAQNTSLWLAWWLHNVISTDELIDAFRSVQGSLHIFDATSSPSPDVLEMLGIDAAEAIAASEKKPGGLVELLRHVRRMTDEAPVGLDERPLVGLALAGAGDAPPLPAGTSAAAHIATTGAGLVLPSGDPDISHVLVPSVKHSPYYEVDAVHWTWHVVRGVLPPLAVYGPGEADQMLREATDRAAMLIESSTHRYARHADARLAVGSLSDAFGLPGLPNGISRRAAKLMARADYVAAIVDVARHGEPGASLDPFMLPLLRAVRVARMTAVDYAQRELLR